MKKIRTHYDNLKVSKDAPEEVVRAAFRALSLKYHPDRANDKGEPGKKFKIILDSYKVLIDSEARKTHDEWIAKQESPDYTAKGGGNTRSSESDDLSKFPKYIQAIIHLHTSILAIIQRFIGVLKISLSLLVHPVFLFGLFAISSSYQMWVWSESGAIDRFLDGFLTRKNVADSFLTETALGIEMISLAPGQFLMGSNNGFEDELPRHRVTVPAFEIGKTEVTFDTWEYCVRAAVCYEMPDDMGWGLGNMPVINVSYDAIVNQFLPWLNSATYSSFRLPTESEWEYAARAGEITDYSWGNDIGVGLANCSQECGDEFRYSSPVGSFGPNPFGLYDMHGNVWEWVEDCAVPNYIEAPIDGSAYIVERCRRHTTRGGSWGANASNARASARSRKSGSEKFYSLGFRLARDVN